MPESTPHESSIDSGAAATALADPPQPPSTPPGAVATGAPKPRRGRGPLIAAIVTALVALALIGVS
ncbi:MAG: hypothetical protein HGB10_11865, partial [Coriobacteriia bacterium]|nr:hypothetical protein [Coriobacteriia bacterium]